MAVIPCRANKYLKIDFEIVDGLFKAEILLNIGMQFAE